MSGSSFVGKIGIDATETPRAHRNEKQGESLFEQLWGKDYHQDPVYQSIVSDGLSLGRSMGSILADCEEMLRHKSAHVPAAKKLPDLGPMPLPYCSE